MNNLLKKSVLVVAALVSLTSLSACKTTQSSDSATLAAGDLASLRGSWNGMGFQVYVYEQSQVQLTWDSDGSRMLFNYNPTPAFNPRCFCDVYENGIRSVTVEHDVTSGAVIGVTYAKQGTPDNGGGSASNTGSYTLQGTWKGISFSAAVQEQTSVQLTWLDNGQKLGLVYNPTPAFNPRCFCDVYENGIRSVIVEHDVVTGQPKAVTYMKQGG
jgi:hypothetical protein